MFFRQLLFAVYIGLTAGVLLVVPARANFNMSAQMLQAARIGDTATIERLLMAGANINYRDATGMSIVCTALMNGDIRAAQILQTYGADASQCDRQARRYQAMQPQYEKQGMFTGLSDQQNLVLVGGAAALAVGGLYMFGGGFGMPGNNLSGGGSGDRPTGNNPGGGGPGTGTGNPTERITIQYGPLQWNTNANRPRPEFDLQGSMNLWSDNLNADFVRMSGAMNPERLDPIDPFQSYFIIRNNIAVPAQQFRHQNYLTIMGGYASLARGYTGQIVARGGPNNLPLEINANTIMSPITVALITANGINPIGTAYRNARTGCPPGVDQGSPGCTLYTYRNLNSDGSERGGFDFSGAGTVFNTNHFNTNPYLNTATGMDTLLAQIIIGNRSYAYSGGDFLGFMPNGQLALYRTGGGWLHTANLGAFSVDVTIGGSALTSTLTFDGNDYVFGTDFTIDPRTGHVIFIGGARDGQRMAAQGNNLFDVERQAYRNFDALNHALTQATSTGRQSPGTVIANAAILDSMRDRNTTTINDLMIVPEAQRANAFFHEIITHYSNGITAANIDINNSARNFFQNINSNSPFVIFSAGEHRLEGVINGTQFATFENAAPLLFSNTRGRFLTATAVQYTAGTSGVNQAAGEVSGGLFRLSEYSLFNADGTYETFRARACGIAGTGTGAIDPWCFAVAGLTGEQAVSTLAGVAGVLQGAFSYMSNDQIFRLMALTSDGRALSQAQLEARYELPLDMLVRLDGLSGDARSAEWMRAFNETFGYGLANLERATRPGEQLLFFGNSTRVGDGRWTGAYSGALAAAGTQAATTFQASNAFGGDPMTISMPMFGFVQAYNGESMPLVFQNDIQVGGERHGLHLIDLLNEIDFDKDDDAPIRLSMTADGMAVRSLRVNFAGDDYKFGGEFRERLGFNTFDNDNPIQNVAGIMTSAFYEREIGGGFNHRFSFFGGQVTDEGLLQHDPSLADRWMPVALGTVYGFDSSVGVDTGLGMFRFGGGYMHEDNTTLGAYTGGLFNFGGGETIYANAEVRIGAFTARYMAAQTRTNPGTDGFIAGLSNLYSDAYSLNADFGRWSFNVSRPLAITRGTLSHVQTDWEIIDNGIGMGMDLETNSYINDISLAANNRETRAAFLYQPDIKSERTRLAFGVVARHNPNNMAGFEGIGMMKFNRIFW